MVSPNNIGLLSTLSPLDILIQIWATSMDYNPNHLIISHVIKLYLALESSNTYNRQELKYITYFPL